jgi:hypothetical protein
LDKYQEAIAYLRQHDSKDSGYMKEIAGMIEELRVKAMSTERKPTSAQRSAMARERERAAVISQMERRSRGRYEPQMQ